MANQLTCLNDVVFLASIRTQKIAMSSFQNVQGNGLYENG